MPHYSRGPKLFTLLCNICERHFRGAWSLPLATATLAAPGPPVEDPTSLFCCASHVSYYTEDPGNSNRDSIDPTTRGFNIYYSYTVKRVDEVVRHRHLVTQDQNTQISKKVFDIPTENFTINIELFRQTFTNVELLR
jgi:hypothetical protein